ncbi:MAG: hypothetical protein HON94_07955 [Methylococcales bacterium]|jgi:hypothetical protein|nr:hypothetical protein [Methylococcales bacterium]MBT7408910.1 hypothetical protein [Methylococcales bacterium]
MPTIRNLYAKHPLMSKGGAHTKSKTSQRVQQRESLLDEVADYFYEHQQSKQADTDLDDQDVNDERELEAPFFNGGILNMQCEKIGRLLKSGQVSVLGYGATI